MTLEPSWQLDPNDPNRWRWWDGTRWTDHTSPIEYEPTVEPEPVSEAPGLEDLTPNPDPVASHGAPAGTGPAAPSSTTGASIPPAYVGAVWNASPPAPSPDLPVWETTPVAGAAGAGEELAPPPPGSGFTVGPSGVIATILAVLGSVVALGAGVAMASLSSVAGNTVAESFYNAFGWAVIGATLCFLASFVARSRT